MRGRPTVGYRSRLPSPASGAYCPLRRASATTPIYSYERRIGSPVQAQYVSPAVSCSSTSTSDPTSRSRWPGRAGFVQSSTSPRRNPESSAVVGRSETETTAVPPPTRCRTLSGFQKNVRSPDEVGSPSGVPMTMISTAPLSQCCESPKKFEITSMRTPQPRASVHRNTAAAKSGSRPRSDAPPAGLAHLPAATSSVFARRSFGISLDPPPHEASRTIPTLRVHPTLAVAPT
jgi:hypothetical protein